jgi:hypothetical protein
VALAVTGPYGDDGKPATRAGDGTSLAAVQEGSTWPFAEAEWASGGYPDFNGAYLRGESTFR